jgi:hypothetical protein
MTMILIAALLLYIGHEIVKAEQVRCRLMADRAAMRRLVSAYWAEHRPAMHLTLRPSKRS